MSYHPSCQDRKLLANGQPRASGWMALIVALGIVGCDAIPIPGSSTGQAQPSDPAPVSDPPGEEPGDSVPSTKARVSVSPFPYDNTLEAVKKVSALVRTHGDVYTVQLDNGIPWEEAQSGTAFSAGLKDQWKRHKDTIAPHQKVYVAIAPLAEDRTSWSESHGGAKTPAWAKEEKRLTPELKSAYEKYVLRVVDYFKPDFLNIGVEAGDMAAKLPSKWPIFTEVFNSTAKAVRSRYPGIKIGISTGLPFLQMEGVLARANSIFEKSDYVGISFYPYMTEFYERFGAPPLPPPPKQWREPLDWLRRNTSKPIAICETGYSSEGVDIPKHRLKLKGDADLQARYTADLAELAIRDGYLFTVFFLAVDYDVLMAKMAPNDENQRLWRRTGFFGTNGLAKPAWRSFRNAWFQKSPEDRTDANPVFAKAPDSEGGSSGTTRPNTPPAESSGSQGLLSSGDLFLAPSPDVVRFQSQNDGPKFMRWTYSYTAGQFAWAAKNVPATIMKGAKGLSFDLRSTRPDPLLLQIEESDGEAFYCVLKPSKTWTPTRLSWSDFTVAAGKKRNGVVDPARITKLLLADSLATSGAEAKGSRSVDISRMEVLTSERKE